MPAMSPRPSGGQHGMATVISHMSMSLDGYVAGPDQSQEHPIGLGGPGTAPVALRPDAPGGRPLAGAAARPGRRVHHGTQHVRTGARTLAGRLARLVGQ